MTVKRDLQGGSGLRGFRRLSREIVSCEKCPRLREYAVVVVKNKPARFIEHDFWGRPVPGFGDLSGKLMIVGLAPAKTGALRTGRIFTGDASARFLVKALHSTGFANHPFSESIDDGLVYNDCYLTAAVKCAPPGDRPTPAEFRNCSSYLDSEVSMMRNLRSVLALGEMAFRACIGHLSRTGADTRGLRFSHGGVFRLGNRPTLYACYHPSPRNTNTGVLTQDMLVSVLRRIRSDLLKA